MTAARMRGGSSASARKIASSVSDGGGCLDRHVGYLGAILLVAGVWSAPLVEVGVDQHLAGVRVPCIRANSGPRHVQAEQHGLNQVLALVGVAGGEQSRGTKQASPALEDIRAELVFPGPIGLSHIACTR
jgi:hypothetical protein